MRALITVWLGFCKILDIVKLYIVKTTITILSQTIYIAHPYLLYIQQHFFQKIYVKCEGCSAELLRCQLWNNTPFFFTKPQFRQDLYESHLFSWHNESLCIVLYVVKLVETKPCVRLMAVSVWTCNSVRVLLGVHFSTDSPLLLYINLLTKKSLLVFGRHLKPTLAILCILLR